MNGEIVFNSHSVSVLSCTKSVSPVHDDKTINMTQDERRSPMFFQRSTAKPVDGRRTNLIGATTTDSRSDSAETASSYSQHPPCWSEDRPSPPQLHYTQTLLQSAGGELALPLATSLSPAPLHTNNRSALHRRQRRGVPNRVKQRKSIPRIARGENSQNLKVTDFYPIRRSSRKSKTELKCEQKKVIDDLITNGIEEGMKVQHIEGKGRAVFATRCFRKGEYVVEYHGDLLEITDAKKREAEYAQNPETGCYMYYFQYLCKTFCVDATKETNRMGRLINHSKNGNCQTKLHDINGVPHLILVASRDIDEGEELLYDYGDRSKASIAAYPWLKH
ncbi:N-lysine methyltransferase KMT5A-A [Aulostomus maculatus]